MHESSFENQENPGGLPRQAPPPYAQPERPSEAFQPSGTPSSQTYPPQPMYQQPPQATPHPAMSGNLWQQSQPYPPQPQMYPPQQMYQQAPAQVAAVNVNINAQQGANGCVRAIYFVFIGWWLGLWCLEIGFLLCALIITLPVGLMILNRLPQIMTLKPTTQTVQTNVNVASVGGPGGSSANVVNVNVSVTGVQQHPFLLRAVYYIFIGCWVGYIWASLAYFFCLTIFGLPLGIIMLNYLPAVLTLRRN